MVRKEAWNGRSTNLIPYWSNGLTSPRRFCGPVQITQIIFPDLPPIIAEHPAAIRKVTSRHLEISTETLPLLSLQNWTEPSPPKKYWISPGWRTGSGEWHL